MTSIRISIQVRLLLLALRWEAKRREARRAWQGFRRAARRRLSRIEVALRRAARRIRRILTRHAIFRRVVYRLFGARAVVLALIPRDILVVSLKHLRRRWVWWLAQQAKAAARMYEEPEVHPHAERWGVPVFGVNRPVPHDAWQRVMRTPIAPNFMPIGGGAETPPTPDSGVTGGSAATEAVETILKRVRSQVIDLRDHGVTWDGVDNDSAEVQAAFDDAPAGPTVFLFPNGDGLLSDEVTASRSEVTYMGFGRYATTIIADPNTDWSTQDYLRTVGTEASPITNVTIRDLGIETVVLDGTTSKQAWWRQEWIENLQISSLYVSGPGTVDVDHHTSWQRARDISKAEIHDVEQEMGSSCANVGRADDLSISKIRAYNSVEAVDLHDSDDVHIYDVYATAIDSGAAWDPDEIVDVGSSRNVTISHVTGFDFINGITVKSESIAPMWSDVDISHSRLLDCREVGVWARTGTADPQTQAESLHVSHNKITVAAGGTNGVQIRVSNPTADQLVGIYVHHNEIDAATRGVSIEGVDGQWRKARIGDNDVTCGNGGIYVEGDGSNTFECSDLKLQRNTVVTTSTTWPGIHAKALFECVCDDNDVSGGVRGIYVQNVFRPRLRRNTTDGTEDYGIQVNWSTTTWFADANNVVGALVEDNEVRNFSQGGTGFAGIAVMTTSMGTASTPYYVVRITDNTVYLDANWTGTLDSQIGVRTIQAGIQHFDLLKLTDNICYDMPDPLSIATPGADSETTPNLTKAA